MKIQNAHDKFFKETFSNLEVTRDFLNNHLPEQILKSVDLQNLEMQNGSYVDEELKEIHSDLLFKTKVNQKEGYFYFLFEHKSYTDRRVGLQVLTYMVRIWKQKVNKENASHLPVIIPMVIYHGKENWNIDDSLGGMFLDYETLSDEIKSLIPNFRYLLYDLSKFTDEDIKGRSRYLVAISILKGVNLNSGQELSETIIKVFQALNELEEKDTAMHYFETCMRYVLTSGSKLSKEQFKTVLKEIEQIYPEGSELTMTLAEVFRQEGMEQGMEQGMERGRKEGEVQAFSKMAIKSLTRKFGILSAEYREKITQLDSITLETLIDETDSFESIEDIRKFLDN